MTGTTSLADSPAARAAAASRAQYKQEDYLQSLSDLSEEELREQMRVTLALEKEAMKEWMDSGDCYIISQAGKVHVPTCQSMGRFVNRDAAWGLNLRYPDRLLDGPDEDPIPVWPILRTRAQIESLAKRTACPLCALDLAFLDKPERAITWTYLRARSLNSQHFGTDFKLADGTPLGALTKITTEETIDGLTFSATFSQAEAPITEPDTELMYRTGMRALGNAAQKS
ncbi:hypothetical protein SRABI83_00090 [Arthrobacter sp. Bi83]|uniref:hypothetical protein n=1 Tax=Arthrobacter sp. Bi83 TaxID=2822353 RepID=UPI001E148B47|nr:hypothetical protein [Arthrobacter sp. Bi83]CAH0126374.1 hypothetical protein SRABI83_00090 [Arthrobacter sp. Bi83]